MAKASTIMDTLEKRAPSGTQKLILGMVASLPEKMAYLAHYLSLMPLPGFIGNGYIWTLEHGKRSASDIPVGSPTGRKGAPGLSPAT